MRVLRRSATVPPSSTFSSPSQRRRTIIPITNIEGGRALLNLPGHHSTGAIVAEVRTYGDGPYDTSAVVQISDCSRAVTLDFHLSDPNAFENDLHKVDVMLSTLRDFRRGLVKAQKARLKYDAKRAKEGLDDDDPYAL